MKNMLGNTSGTWGTYWEPIEKFECNLVGTHWEVGKKWKTFLAPLPHPPHPKTLKEKKQGTLSACSGLPIGCMKFLFPKEFVTVFSLG